MFIKPRTTPQVSSGLLRGMCFATPLSLLLWVLILFGISQLLSGCSGSEYLSETITEKVYYSEGGHYSKETKTVRTTVENDSLGMDRKDVDLTFKRENEDVDAKIKIAGSNSSESLGKVGDTLIGLGEYYKSGVGAP